MKRAIFNWSGGKDSALCLYKVLQQKEFEVVALLTSVSEKYQRVSMHGVKIELLEEQAKQIGIPLVKMVVPHEPSMEAYEKAMNTILEPFIRQGVEYSIFGDIFLEDLKQYRIDKLAQVGLKAEFPIWKNDTKELVNEFINKGFKTLTTCVSEKFLPEVFVGRLIDEEFVKQLPENVDPCGENGEFHTFVYEGPIFKESIPVSIKKTVYKTYKSPENVNEKYGFWYAEIE